MKKILIIYYTGTFNTLYLVNQFIFKATSYECTKFDVFNFKKNDDLNIIDYDYIGLFYPIYAFNSPNYFEKIIKQLQIKDKEYFIIKNSGEPLPINNASSNKIFKILKKNNCQLMFEYHLIMPYYIIFKHDDIMVKQMLKYNNDYLDYIINNFDTRISYNPKFIYKIMAFLGRLQRFGAKVNSKLYHINKRKCNRCLKCVNDCPTKNIFLNKNKIRFKSKCIMCMRCSANCPKNAINIGFLNHWKVNNKYDFKNISKNVVENDYFKYCSKRFYKIYHKYYDNLDKVLKNKV